jgi:hypothetical protein
VAKTESAKSPQSFRAAPPGTPDAPVPSALKWIILLAFVAFCLLVLWMKGR